MTQSPTKYLKRACSSPRGQAILVTVIVFCLILVPLWTLGNTWLADRYIADEKNSGLDYLNALKDSMNKALDRDYGVVTSLSNHIIANSSSLDSEKEFETYVRKITYFEEIESISFKHKSDPAYYFRPYGGNISTGMRNLPFEITKLIYIDGEYWGYVTITINVPTLIRNSDPARGSSGENLVIVDTKGNLVFGDSLVLDQNPVVVDLFIPPDNSWKLGTVPIGGWVLVAQTKLIVLWYLGFVIIFLIALLFGLITYRQASLRCQVRERTKSLMKINIRLRQEIEEHRLSVRALATSEKKYFTLFNSADDMVILCNCLDNPRRYPVVEINEYASRLLGYTMKEHYSRNLFDGVPSGSRDCIPGIFDEIERKGHAIFEINYLTYKGNFIPVEMNAIQFMLEGKPVLLAVGRDISSRKKVEYDLRQSIAEKDVLLKEIHHRVKNNLQVITSLIDLQSMTINDPLVREHFCECQDRIRSMALVHENLYKSKNFSTIKSYEYIRMLVDHLVQSCSPKPGISVGYEFDDIDLDPDTAISCGFVINELVTNALKHAFTNKDKGTIHISMKHTSDTTLTLVIKDDGSGFPEDVDFMNTKSLGLQIVTILARQLDAEVSMVRGAGTMFVLIFSDIQKRSEARNP